MTADSAALAACFAGARLTAAFGGSSSSRSMSPGLTPGRHTKALVIDNFWKRGMLLQSDGFLYAGSSTSCDACNCITEVPRHRLHWKATNSKRLLLQLNASSHWVSLPAIDYKLIMTSIHIVLGHLVATALPNQLCSIKPYTVLFHHSVLPTSRGIWWDIDGHCDSCCYPNQCYGLELSNRNKYSQVHLRLIKVSIRCRWFNEC